ncbi:radial spoke head protein 4 homolog A-like [Musca vetustissima]|uniref:radial spoke head protein 4 homolog A-like n=1 Tax=Musca vetustissima TaxID=27455 RepID=UPI002AB6CED6|nr:radial spoke head protein 4 homolog A-like [Musca vetustissima]
MNLDTNFSCTDFIPSDTSSSVKIGGDYPYQRAQPASAESEENISKRNESVGQCPSGLLTSTSSSSSVISSALFNQDCRKQKLPRPAAPNIGYELSLAKSIMQQYSSISGDNLFDHLSDIIKRVIDERPPNVIDFFEEFSRNVREQKLHLPERFPSNGVYEEHPLYKVAKKQLMSMKLPMIDYTKPGISEEDLEEDHQKEDDLKLPLKPDYAYKFRIFNERVQHLQFYWNQCGFSISSEDIFQLACSMDRIQTHPCIRQCRFWGMINGLKASYYIVEALLTNEEIDSRFLQMHKEIEEMQWRMPEEVKLPSHIGPELTPGSVGWENYPADELDKMIPPAMPIPTVKTEELFDIPPEPIGRGVNRFSYFVVNSLSDEWIELPICTPKQIVISRKIKKFLTGDLEADIISYPCFPGKEKHYLRAMIARITAGTYIAPKGYYRKMSKAEQRLFDGIVDDEMGDEEDEEHESTVFGEGEGEEDNDIVFVKNEKYIPRPLTSLNNPSQWLHARPNILKQGRVTWFDEGKAKRDRQRELKRLEKLRRLQEMGLEEGNNEEDEEEDESEENDSEEGGDEEEELEEPELREYGPSILTPCSRDANDEMSVPWIGRFTSNFTNSNERILIMRSNLWPGAYTFAFEDLCDSIYLGWGNKYVRRNMTWHHPPEPAEEYPHEAMDFVEATDPSVELEEAYRLSLLKKELQLGDMGEHLMDYENESHESADDNTDDDEDEEEEEEEEEEE